MRAQAAACAACGGSIDASAPRWRCTSCDDLVLCEGCGDGRDACSACGWACLYRDGASPLALRRAVFREAFAESRGTDAVHPWEMARRAFEAVEHAYQLCGRRS